MKTLRLTSLRGAIRAFSLLEVMVAVAILGLVLTVILSAQGGIAASNRAAAKAGYATTVARCKMTEVEERLLKLGYPEIDQVDTDIACCDDSDPYGFRCDTRVEKVVLPNPPSNSLGDGGFLSLSGSRGASTGAATAGASTAGALGALGGLNPAGGAGLNLSMDGGLGGIGTGLASQVSGMGGSQGLLQTVMGIVYPSLKLMMEASIRRLTVTVRWHEGLTVKDLTLVQYVTNPQRGGFLEGFPGADGGVMAPGAGPGTGAGGLGGAGGGLGATGPGLGGGGLGGPPR